MSLKQNPTKIKMIYEIMFDALGPNTQKAIHKNKIILNITI